MHKIPIAGPFTNVIISKPLMVCALLFVLVLAQSLAIIYTKQHKRILHANLQSLYALRDKLQVEWSQLLLEQGTLEADARVERMARKQLDMVVPEKVNVIIP